MQIENWSDIAPSFIKVPLNAYKYRHILQKWWKNLLVYTNRGDTNIAVLGRPSVGKSVMASYLYGETNNLSWELPETSKDVEARAFTLGNWTNIVRVIPGQTTNERYLGLHEVFDKSTKLDGIIYVADWGFTDVRDKIVKQQMIESEGLKQIKDIRDFNLKLELEDFKIICKEIEKAYVIGKSSKWLLIIVNKADLFFEDKTLNLAQQYYHPKGSSAFSKIIQSTISKIGEQRLKCASIPLCSFEKDFVWNKEKVITKIGGEENRKALMKHFFTTVANF